MGISERRKREKEGRQALIMEKARELFSEHDYEAVTMSQIAAASELGKGTLYSYFDSKESIYIALYQEGLGILREMLSEEVEAEASAVEHLQSMGARFLQFYFDYPEYFRIMFFFAHANILASRPDEAAPLYEAGYAIRSELAGMVRQGIDQGHIGPCDPMITADVMWGAMLGLVMMMQFGKSEAFISHSPEAMFLRLAEILLHGLAQPSMTSAGEARGD